ncbi:Hydroxyethylthiazole kinase [Labeo rohita]|uniref:Hydroxyethylthiazole kinase n=1 Tax=Labeo rohita TaxID=84645 RepID=A0ABQ8L310_LABRO|nr:Hydroxyethylthiazole kinase [Labeo rohita]
MERLSDILASYPSAGPQRSSASSWSFRQQKASDRWKEARPDHLKCLIAKEAVGHPLCWLCHEPAVIRLSVFPRSGFVGSVMYYVTKNSHSTTGNVSFMDFFEAIPPTSYAIKEEDGYRIHEQACILPTVKVPDCSCESTNFTILPGKPEWILASVTNSTLYTLDVLSSFQELKRSFLEFSCASFEEEQLCCGAPFTCPACTPEMLAVSADGNRKQYRFRRETSSDDPGFFKGLFVAEDSAVSRFVDTKHKAVRNVSFKYNYISVTMISFPLQLPLRTNYSKIKLRN